MLPSFLKTAVLGHEPRFFRIRVGLNRGLRFRLDPANKASRLVGLDELELARSFRRYSALAQVALDVGAADGWYTLFLASRPNIRRVHAFEPEPGLRAALMENLTLNGCASKVTLRSEFVGATAGANRCPLDAVDMGDGAALVKVDVEGAELEVLRGAGKMIARPDTMWIIETHAAHLEVECADLLEAAGYATRVVDHGWYRRLLPERRPLPHNRWLVAARH